MRSFSHGSELGVNSLHPTLHVTSDSEKIPVSFMSFKHLYLALTSTKTFLLKTARPLIYM